MRFLDYVKVKEAEREKGRELFGSAAEPTALATQVSRAEMFQPAIFVQKRPDIDWGGGFEDHRQEVDSQPIRRRRLRGSLEAVEDQAHRGGEEEAPGQDQEGDQPAGDYRAGEGA